MNWLRGLATKILGLVAFGLWSMWKNRRIDNLKGEVNKLRIEKSNLKLQNKLENELNEEVAELEQATGKELLRRLNKN